MLGYNGGMPTPRAPYTNRSTTPVRTNAVAASPVRLQVPPFTLPQSGIGNVSPRQQPSTPIGNSQRSMLYPSTVQQQSPRTSVGSNPVARLGVPLGTSRGPPSFVQAAPDRGGIPVENVVPAQFSSRLSYATANSGLSQYQPVVVSSPSPVPTYTTTLSGSAGPQPWIGQVVQANRNPDFAVLKAFSNEDLLQELAERGVDIQSFAIEKSVDDNFNVQQVLGEGAFGKVYKVTHKATKKDFAMKTLMREVIGAVDDVEIQCLKTLKHKNLVNLFEIYETATRIWLIMELVEGGELQDYIVEKGHHSEHFAAHCMRQVLQGIHYMHSHGVVHRDLKPANILISAKVDDCVCKVADFGLSGIIKDYFDTDVAMQSQDMKASQVLVGQGFCGTPLFMAPEVCTDTVGYGPQCDLWSLGIILHELLSGELPFDAETLEDLYDQICDPDPHRFLFRPSDAWVHVSQGAKLLVKALVMRDAVQRLSAKEALRMSWIQEKDNNSKTHLHVTHARLKQNKAMVPNSKKHAKFQRKGFGGRAATAAGVMYNLYSPEPEEVTGALINGGTLM
eukprot:gnl/MRDRNA2_/MRDRNA2_133982_c0_seq1.p1 gnl/MRDRNA2_/MRDRNA2_133982_c0~~gnl/MRDRNA2_/MRDRNA2_133982_c0_seq1.p1  ORF type:complete len:562 (-),score=101.16 gnl/MRDRNA2_/MRDRNA2_133982_c0_seq1:16-1701(-)